MPKGHWEICADTGGTFTDAIGVAPDGAVHRAKVLSSATLRARVVEHLAEDQLRLQHSWGAWAGIDDAATGWTLAHLGTDLGAPLVHWRNGCIAHIAGDTSRFAVGDLVEVRSGEEAPILAARLLTGTPARAALPAIRMRLATTRGTNALLTGRFPPTALVINRGLGDLLRIGTQQRPDLFALDIRRPPPLHAAVLEVAGRLDARGVEIQPPDPEAIARDARALIAAGIRDAAVCLLHADLNPSHEEVVAQALRGCGFDRVSVSSRIAPFVKILPRATTTLVNACLAPVIGEYLDRVRNALSHPGSSLLVMTSAGGLSSSADFLPKDSLLSGPAAGVVGAAEAAADAGLAHALSFDMGGTSTDAARWSASTGIEYVFEHTVGAATLVAPAAAVETVAAGGGSICTFRAGALCVGPESAGSQPGPACYGAGGPLTLTDVNLLLGRLCPDRFVIPVDRAAAQRAFAAVKTLCPAPAQSDDRLLEGFVSIAAERMAGAVRRISTRRGHDLRGAGLVAFGGAGGQHACAIALRLGIDTVLVPRDAGLLSARGLAAAAVERFAQRQILSSINAIGSRLAQCLDQLGREAVHLAMEAGDGAAASVRRRIAAVRFVGQESALELDLPPLGSIDAATLTSAFAARHAEIYGFAPGGREVEVVWLRVVASVVPTMPREPRPDAAGPAARAVGPVVQQACFGGRWVPTRVMDRSLLQRGERIEGPAIIAEEHATIVVEPGWTAAVNAVGDVVLRRTGADTAAASGATTEVDDPAAIELFTARFESIASEMGEMLARASVSVNVKERLDFSCALLDPSGSLVACAPHVPVHLGSLGVCVRSVVAALPLGPGESAITNHPAHGGSHLPDVTVITAVHTDQARLLGYVASRAHHAELGGVTPGSMPPDATSLGQEGVIIAPFKLVEGGCPRLDRLEALLLGGANPSRNVADNLADVRAALAANARGAAMLRELAHAGGAPAVHAFMEAIQRRSDRLLRERISRLPPGERFVADAMDDGAPVRVRITPDGDGLVADFSGSSPVHPGNLNATPAIVSSCMVYVMRVLLGHAAPLNEGLLRPVRIILPAGMLNPPFPPGVLPDRLPAVVGGNVETSQRVVDVLLRALGLCASSQGTMNNLVFGADGATPVPSYYETICGGAGAGPGFDGAAAVHTHMTNTRITDPEILERRYPVRLERFAVRAGSGGQGQQRGGDGVERIIRFLAPLRVSLLTQRRVAGPPGFAGGEPGAPGAQFVTAADGRRTMLPPITGFDARAGDVLTILTPGGGGYGPPGAPG